MLLPSLTNVFFPPHISKSLNFKKFTDTELLATFDKDIQWVEKVSVKFSTGNVLQPKRKLRILRIRLKNLEPKGNKAQGYAKILPLRNDTQHQLVSLLKHCRFTDVSGFSPHRPLCRYDVLLEENKEVTFRPIPCEESNF